MPTKKTVLLTGATGFIAKHIALKLLNAGYIVVGSVRSLERGEEVKAAVAPHLNTGVAVDDQLRFVALDLGNDSGWAEAMAGIDILMHTASPFPLEQPKDEDELIRPAVDGALRAIKAAHAAGIKRVVMTSSSVAIMEGELPAGKSEFDENDWTDLTGDHVTPYAKSKTMAERAVWDYVKAEAPEIDVTMINPSLVTGPPLDRNFGSSVSIIQRLLRGKDPMLPKFGMPIVDVRDIAEMHLRALEIPASVGKRFIGAASSLWFHEMAEAIKERFPERKIVTRLAPNFVVRLIGLFDKSVRQILPNLGSQQKVSNKQARGILGIEFIPARQSIVDTADYLVKNNLID